MFKETRGLEYALELLRIFHKNPGKHDSKALFELMRADKRVELSLSYVQKILPRLVKANLFISSGDGYTLVKPIDEITVDRILDLCDMPDPASPLYKLCDQLKQAVSLSTIDEFYDFS